MCYCLGFLYIWQGYKVRHIVVAMNDENFEVVFHHGGRFVNESSLKYVGGSSTLLCDPDNDIPRQWSSPMGNDNHTVMFCLLPKESFLEDQKRNAGWSLGS